MSETPWRNYSTYWDHLPPPMRPTPSIIDVMTSNSTPGHVLLLGVTPEIHAAFDHVTAIDRDSSMIANVWPGNTDNKQVQQGSWTEMDWPEATFDTIIGDCAIPLLTDVDSIAAFQTRCLHWLKPGGSFVHRLMQRPETAVTRHDIARELSGPATINFHAMRWRMQQCIAADNNGVAPAMKVRELFESLVPDRDALCDITGWKRIDVDSIDLYKGNTNRIFFGSQQQWRNTIPANAVDIRWTYVFDHDISEDFPVMRWRKPL